MKIWLDDERTMPEEYDTHCETAEQAIELIRSGNVTHISLDHDLGTEMTGYDVAKAIAELAYHNKIPRIRVKIHTQNPIGRQNMATTIQNAYNYWSNHEVR